jgi:hypothetical protein
MSITLRRRRSAREAFTFRLRRNGVCKFLRKDRGSHDVANDTASNTSGMEVSKATGRNNGTLNWFEACMPQVYYSNRRTDTGSTKKLMLEQEQDNNGF